MKFNYNDGGRKEAGYLGSAGDCAARAISVATGKSYDDVYALINFFSLKEKRSKRKKGRSSARTGVYKATFKRTMDHLGWTWVPTMFIGKGCTTHLRDGEIPMDKSIICNVSRHYVAVINGVINDTHDPSRNGNRCVYGYFIKLGN